MIDISTWTKKQMKEKCKEILRRGYIKDEEQNFLHQIIGMHTEYNQKKGVGIKKFFIQKNQYKINGFYLERNDGTITDFSYIHSITPRTNNQKISIACRTAIRCDVFDIKNGDNDIHVHHENISFAEIVKIWRKKYPNLDLSVNKTYDNNEITYFTNNVTEESFKKFHRDVALLKVMPAKEHMKFHGLVSDE